MFSYVKLVEVVSQDLAHTQWQQKHSSVRSSSSWTHCKIMDCLVFQLQAQLLEVNVLVAVAGHFSYQAHSSYSVGLKVVVVLYLEAFQKIYFR